MYEDERQRNLGEERIRGDGVEKLFWKLKLEVDYLNEVGNRETLLNNRIEVQQQTAHMTRRGDNELQE